GKVEVRKSIGDRKYKKLVELGPCGLIGEVCFLGVQFRSANVVAIEDTTTLEFERADFEKLVEENPLIGMKVYRGMAQELAQRLVRVDEELKDAITWAMKDLMKKSQTPQIVMPKPIKLKLADQSQEEVL
ncbi:MAG: cyclic nucleotide-binding domain-containing protein, partial [Lentisphaerota bacterium]